MSPTIRERDMLKTAVPERAMSVTTYLQPGHSLSAGPSRCPPWTVVWQDPSCHAVWLHFWRGPTTPGGLAEAHESVVAQVRRGAIPAQGSEQQEAWGTMAEQRARDPATYDRIRTAREGPRPVQAEGEEG